MICGSSLREIGMTEKTDVRPHNGRDDLSPTSAKLQPEKPRKSWRFLGFVRLPCASKTALPFVLCNDQVVRPASTNNLEYDAQA
jgi:hypothetical protein